MEYVCIGKLVNTHGIKGEVKLLSNFEYKDKAFVVGINFYIGEDKEKVTVNSYRHHKVFDMVTFKEYNYINDVLKFKGKLVYVLRTDLALDNNSILDSDYIGMNAYYEGVLVGKVNDRYFINIASIGLDAEVAYRANKLKSFHLPKKLIYLISLIKTFFIYKGIKVKIDGKEKEITIFTVCNAKYYGGGFKIAPNAKINNGVFDVVDIKSISKFKILTILTKLINAKHTKSRYVDICNKDSISIKSDNPILCNIDGEVMIDTKFDFHIEKGAIKYSSDSIGICKVLRRKKLIK